MTHLEQLHVAMNMASRSTPLAGPEDMPLGQGHLVRVELHGVSHDDSLEEYLRLHEEMQALGFLRTVMFEQVEYELPHATYLFRGTSSSLAVKNHARGAVRKVVAKDEDASITVDGPAEIVAFRLRRKQSEAKQSAYSRLRNHF